MTTKRCRDCNEVKPSEAFNRDKNRPDGRYVYCKPCKRAQSAESYARNRSTSTEYNARYYATEQGKGVLARACKKWSRANRTKRLAQRAVERAVDAGKFPRISELACTACAKQANVYHHESYLPNERLNVRALCFLCHKAVHSEAA